VGFEVKSRRGPKDDPPVEPPAPESTRPPEELPAGYREYYGLPVQKKSLSLEPSSDDIQQAARQGTGGAGQSLPHLDRIQASFGKHDVGGIRAHDDAQAQAAAQQMEARAFAVGEQVAFGGAADLHTAAHEAAHVVQQRAGVHLKKNVGEEGDAYEQHADAVADQVVRGRSAEALLDGTPGAGVAASAVQLAKLAVPVSTKDNKELEVEYVESRRPGKRFDVTVPSGLDPGKRNFIAEKLGCKPDELCIVNRLDDDWQEGGIGSKPEEKQPRGMSNALKQRFASARITQFLRSVGIGSLDGKNVEELLEAQVGRVSFVTTGEFVERAPQAYGEGSEGHTEEGKRGERAIAVDTNNSTWGSVVHEVIRALAHPNVESLPEVMVDGIVEVLTRAATGLDVRSSRGNKPVFAEEVELVNQYLGRMGPAGLAPAYFQGRINDLFEALEKIEEALSPYQGEFNLPAFVNNGKIRVPARRLLPLEKHLARKGKQFVAQLPRALTGDELNEVAQQLKCELGQIHFITKIPPKVQEVETGPMYGSRFHVKSDAEQKQEDLHNGELRVAVERVRAYLSKVGITQLEDKAIEDALKQQSQHVTFLHQTERSREMSLFMRGVGGASPESTEGLTRTDPQFKRFERPTAINIENHTWGTVVHELFHGLEHDGLRALSDMLVEGMTEILTQRATGLDVRCARGNRAVYSQNTQLIDMALERNVINDQQIRDAYFHGQVSPGLRQVDRTCQGPGSRMQSGSRLPKPEDTAGALQEAERMLIPARGLSLTRDEVNDEFGVSVPELVKNQMYTQRSSGMTYRYDGHAVMTLRKHNFTPV
jgi:hypothetical protein